MTTISVNKTHGLVLNPASYANPIIINTGVTISNSSGNYAVSIAGASEYFII